MSQRKHVTQREVHFDPGEILVSKTDLQGRITYVNRTFTAISGYAEAELLGKPHSVIRHPDMPRAIFKLLWEHLHDGREVFAYVVNRCASGDHYWVFAHVTPSFDLNGTVVGYHSTRRIADRRVLDDVIIPLYRRLREVEERAPDRRSGLETSYRDLTLSLQDAGASYDEWIFSH